MAVTKLQIIYNDGTEKTVQVTPRAHVMTEEKYGTSESVAVRVLYHWAWASLHLSGGESADFDTWIDKIADVEDVTPKKNPADPTVGGEPSPGESSL